MSLKKSFQGTALVTGAAKRIGRAICFHLAELGFNIAIHYNRSQAEAKKLQSELKAFNIISNIFPCDLSNEKKVSLLIKDVYKNFPDLKLLINSASIFEKSQFRSASLDSLNRHYAVNFKAPFILSQAFANICKRGQIINILDTNIVKNQTQHHTYLLTKKLLFELTKMTAVELAPRIRVNAIAPGAILPPDGKGENYLKARAKQSPMLTKGDVGHITSSVEFLINNPFVTGQVIYADGGAHLI